ncbi:unnamed protein product, partial [uncultured virus]
VKAAKGNKINGDHHGVEVREGKSTTFISDGNSWVAAH